MRKRRSILHDELKLKPEQIKMLLWLKGYTSIRALEIELGCNPNNALVSSVIQGKTKCFAIEVEIVRIIKSVLPYANGRNAMNAYRKWKENTPLWRRNNESD